MLDKNLLQTSGELFKQVQLKKVFPDQKTFVDSIPKTNSQSIQASFNKSLSDGSLDLRKFILDNFETQQERKTNSKTNNINDYIKNFINSSLLDFTSPIDNQSNTSSIINLPNKHLVPGGRFHEFYYWDTYFTALGLADNQLDILAGMLNNFAYMIEKYGFIPNGNRTYYLSRSQPPFFSLLTELFISKSASHKEFTIDYEKYFNLLETEYSFWMSEERAIDNLTNRYYDNLNIPRAEGYSHDCELYDKQSKFQQTDFYRQIRAVCESGWDFSTRWNGEDNNIDVLHIAPVDLNCLIYNLEKLLAKFSLKLQNDKYDYYYNLAETRAKKINSFFWNNKTNFYHDINFKAEKHTSSISLAGVFPLFFKIASEQQAHYVANKIQKDFLYLGGLTTTVLSNDVITNNQWDHPNGWAPLQYITIVGLINYNHIDLAQEIAHRFTRCIEDNFKQHNKILEKYNVVDCSIDVNHGEYEIQDGFGWTNGVYIKLKDFLSSGSI